MRAILTITILLVSLSGCGHQRTSMKDGGPTKGGDAEDRARIPARDTTENMDRDMVFLIDMLPLGSSYQQAKAVFPMLGELGAELVGREVTGHPGELTDAEASVHVLGHRVQLGLNFQDDSLYHFGCITGELSQSAGSTLIAHLESLYTDRYGDPVIEEAQDSPYYVRSLYWWHDDYEISVHVSYVGSNRRIGWGFQRPVNVLLRER